jgi:hypothetical protein
VDGMASEAKDSNYVLIRCAPGSCAAIQLHAPSRPFRPVTPCLLGAVQLGSQSSQGAQRFEVFRQPCQVQAGSFPPRHSVHTQRKMFAH